MKHPPLNLFFCYASADKRLRVKLAEYLIPMQHQKLIGDMFCDGEILSGEEWDKKIREQLEQADIILLLVSSAFLASRYIQRVELKRAMARHALGTALVIPVIVRKCDEWERTRLRKLQILPTGCKAVSAWARKDDAWNDVANGIRKSAEAFRERRGAVRKGIAKAEQFHKSERRFPGEVYAIELLQRTIGIERTTTGTLRITIDRTGVKEYIISNEGKETAFKRYKVYEKRVKIIDRDRQIQSFLAGREVDQIKFDPWKELRIRLRWASGGVMSIIRRAGEPDKQWIPFFFRDIPPYGWNLALGSAERWFDDVGNQVPGSSIDHELNDPVNSILREFIEEVMVLDDDPSQNKNPAQRGFRLRDSVIPIGQWGQYSAKRTELRRRDGLTIRGDGYGEIDVRSVETECELLVKHGKEEFLATDVLVCFSLTDLGIEVVKVKEYQIGKNEYLLDGEVQPGKKPGEWDLVRMPIALLSVDYLRRIFAGNDGWQNYTDGLPPSIVGQAPPDKRERGAPSIYVQSRPNVSEGEIFLYPHDVDRRIKLLDEGRPTPWERDRYEKWRKYFGFYFLENNKKPSADNATQWFVPGTAKILHLYFTNRRA